MYKTEHLFCFVLLTNALGVFRDLRKYSSPGLKTYAHPTLDIFGCDEMVNQRARALGNPACFEKSLTPIVLIYCEGCLVLYKQTDGSMLVFPTCLS